MAGFGLPPLLWWLAPRAVGAPWPVIMLAAPDLGWALRLLGGLVLAVTGARIGAVAVGNRVRRTGVL